MSWFLIGFIFLQSSPLLGMFEGTAGACCACAPTSVADNPLVRFVEKLQTINPPPSARQAINYVLASNRAGAAGFLLDIFIELGSGTKDGADFINKINKLFLKQADSGETGLSFERKLILLAFFFIIFKNEFDDALRSARNIIIRSELPRTVDARGRAVSTYATGKRDKFIGPKLVLCLIAKMRDFDRQGKQTIRLFPDIVSYIVKNMTKNPKHFLHLVSLIIDVESGAHGVGPFLVRHGIDINAREVGEPSVLMLAAGNDCYKICRSLLAAGAAIDARDEHGRTAFMHALENSCIKTGFDLINAGADLPLNKNGDVEPGNALIIKNAWLQSVEKSRRDALDITWLLMNTGVVCNDDCFHAYELPIFRFLIHRLSFYFSPAAMGIILSYCHGGLDVLDYEDLTDYSRFCLRDIKFHNPYRLVLKLKSLFFPEDVSASAVSFIGYWLINQGIDINYTEEDGNTALMRATEMGLWRVAGALLYAGADLHKINTMGRSVVYMLAQRRRTESAGEQRYFDKMLKLLANPVKRTSQSPRAENRYKMQLAQLFCATCNGLPRELYNLPHIKDKLSRSIVSYDLELNKHLWLVLAPRNFPRTVIALILIYLIAESNGIQK